MPSTEGLIDEWLFQVEDALATHTEEVVRSAVIGSVRGAACKLLEFIGYGEEMSVNLGKVLLKQNSIRNSSRWNKGRQKVLISLQRESGTML